MGGRYCAINSPLGPRWGQKSLDLRSRDFCPHLEPRGELIAQYRPPMSFRYIIHYQSNIEDSYIANKVIPHRKNVVPYKHCLNNTSATLNTLINTKSVDKDIKC